MGQPAVCTKCDKIIVCDAGDVFVMCPHCDKNISAGDAIKTMRDFCQDPRNVSDILARCLDLEKVHGPQLPIAILSVVEENFPLNEDVAYVIVRMSDYDSQVVRAYLSRFKNAKKQHPFTEDFLTQALTVRNMEFVGLFEEYIGTKLGPKRRQRYIDLIRELRERYAKSSNSDIAITLLYAFYIGFGVLNIGLIFAFLFVAIPLWGTALIGLAFLGIQIGLLFGHNRMFGNRLTTTSTERLLMVIYMSSMIVAIGGVFIGGLFTIRV